MTQYNTIEDKVQPTSEDRVRALLVNLDPRVSGSADHPGYRQRQITLHIQCTPMQTKTMHWTYLLYTAQSFPHLCGFMPPSQTSTVSQPATSQLCLDHFLRNLVLGQFHVKDEHNARIPKGKLLFSSVELVKLIHVH